MVKIVDGEHVVAESRPLSGDLTEATVKWRKPPARTLKPLQLRFELKDTKLYSFTLA